MYIVQKLGGREGGKKGSSTAASAGAGTRVKGSHSPTVSHHGTCKHARVDSGVN